MGTDFFLQYSWADDLGHGYGEYWRAPWSTLNSPQPMTFVSGSLPAPVDNVVIQMDSDCVYPSIS
jgi:hypothetical protein